MKIKHLNVFLILLLLLLLLFPILSALQPEPWPVPRGLQGYRVLRVIDGDTIVVDKIGTVRYAGIDAPEINHPERAVDYYGKQAYYANKKLVKNQKVYLETDVQKYDKHGRLLAYVYAGSIFVNARQVETGYAKVLTIPPNVKYANLFVKLQRKARQAGQGMWSNFTPPAANAKNAAYRGNRRSEIFHKSDCKWGKKISRGNLIVFETRDEAVEAGFRPCSACKP